MDSSSENFAWSEASSDSEHSDLMLLTREAGMKSDQFNSPESEKNYKKKLHKKLFTVDSTEDKVKRELLDESKVKQEPSSEVEVKHKKKRHRESSSSHTHHSDHSLQIKLEQNSTEQLSKSSLTSSDELNNFHSTKNNKQKKKRKKKYSEDAQYSEDVQDINMTEINVQSQESKQNKQPEVEVTSQSDDNMQSKKKKKKKLKHESTGNAISEEIINHDPINNIANGTLSEEDNSQKESLPKIADTIQFEKDIDVICNDSNMENHSTQSSRMRQFIKTNIHLRFVSCNSNNESTISSDDDIWLVTCPSEVDVMSFKEKDISLECKSKIKIDGQSYVGNIDSSSSRSTLMTFMHKKPLLKNILHNTLHLHKRLPRTHVMEDNPSVNQQTDFIPLPDTKHRHPLFGIDYKKAMKIPSTIKARLKESETDCQPLPTHKKKMKKHKIRQNYISEKTDHDTSEKSTRKRAPDQDLTPPKQKRIKRDLDANSWDSEKAIEQNLFNF